MAIAPGGVTDGGGAAAPDYADLFAGLPMAVLVVAPTGQVAHANAEAEALLNLSERAMIGQPLSHVIQPPHDARTGQGQGQGLSALDAEVRLARGGAIRVDYLEAEVPEHPGWRSIALHAAAAQRRIGGSGDRTAARAAIGAAAMLAHEIKNPLSGIRGAAQLLASSAGEEGRQLTSLITAEVDRIVALIDRMQGFTDTRPLKLAAENVYPLLDHARRVAAAGFGRGVIFEERFDPSLPSALVDRDVLLQVLLNLVKNACEALEGQADRRVTLATAYRHGMAVIPAPGEPRRPLPIEVSVIDNGPGAPSDIADQLFDPFVSGRENGRGQGLGLALVAKLVRDLGGIVQYAREGSPVQTVFRILLPRAAA